jgi:hypothetical protein
MFVVVSVLSSEVFVFAWLKEEVGVASSLDPEVTASLEASLIISVSSFAVLEEISGEAFLLQLAKPMIRAITANPDTIAIVTLIRFFIRSSSFLLYAWLKRKIRISCREVKSTSLIP